MTTITTSTSPAARWSTPIAFGVAAFALATGLSAIAIFAVDRQQDQVDAFPILVGCFVVLTAIVFSLVVRPAVAGGTTARRVLVLGLVALVGNAVFWAGVPAIVGVATLAVRRHAPRARSASVGVGLAIAALLVNVVATVVG